MGVCIASCSGVYLLRNCGVGPLLDFTLQVAGRGAWEMHPRNGNAYVSMLLFSWDQNEGGSPWILVPP